MLINRNEKYKLKKDIKRRFITLGLSIPFGVGFAVLFYWLKLSTAVQLVLTVVCWGAVYCLLEVVYWAIAKAVAKRNADKPKKKDPFAD